MPRAVCRGSARSVAPGAGRSRHEEQAAQRSPVGTGGKTGASGTCAGPREQCGPLQGAVGLGDAGSGGCGVAGGTSVCVLTALNPLNST